MADFIAECTFNPEVPEPVEPKVPSSGELGALKPNESEPCEVAASVASLLVRPSANWDEEPWILHVDGSSNQQGSGAGIVLRGPGGTKLEYALRFEFVASNNEAEYEALIAGLNLARKVGAKHMVICSDS